MVANMTPVSNSRSAAESRLWKLEGGGGASAAGASSAQKRVPGRSTSARCVLTGPSGSSLAPSTGAATKGSLAMLGKLDGGKPGDARLSRGGGARSVESAPSSRGIGRSISTGNSSFGTESTAELTPPEGSAGSDQQQLGGNGGDKNGFSNGFADAFGNTATPASREAAGGLSRTGHDPVRGLRRRASCTGGGTFSVKKNCWKSMSDLNFTLNANSNEDEGDDLSGHSDFGAGCGESGGTGAAVDEWWGVDEDFTATPGTGKKGEHVAVCQIEKKKQSLPKKQLQATATSAEAAPPQTEKPKTRNGVGRSKSVELQNVGEHLQQYYQQQEGAATESSCDGVGAVSSTPSSKTTARAMRRRGSVRRTKSFDLPHYPHNPPLPSNEDDSSSLPGKATSSDPSKPPKTAVRGGKKKRIKLRACDLSDHTNGANGGTADAQQVEAALRQWQSENPDKADKAERMIRHLSNDHGNDIAPAIPVHHRDQQAQQQQQQQTQQAPQAPRTPRGASRGRSASRRRSSMASGTVAAPTAPRSKSKGRVAASLSSSSSVEEKMSTEDAIHKEQRARARSRGRRMSTHHVPIAGDADDEQQRELTASRRGRSRCRRASLASSAPPEDETSHLDHHQQQQRSSSQDFLHNQQREKRRSKSSAPASSSRRRSPSVDRHGSTAKVPTHTPATTSVSSHSSSSSNRERRRSQSCGRALRPKNTKDEGRPSTSRRQRSDHGSSSNHGVSINNKPKSSSRSKSAGPPKSRSAHSHAHEKPKRRAAAAPAATGKHVPVAGSSVFESKFANLDGAGVNGDNVTEKMKAAGLSPEQIMALQATGLKISAS